MGPGPGQFRSFGHVGLFIDNRTIKPSGLCRSVGRSDEATAARVRLARSQTPGAYFHLNTAVAPASPQSIALVPLRCQLAENLAALQRR